MIRWTHSAITGWIIGASIAVVLIIVVKTSGPDHPVLWSHAVDISRFLFPTYIFMLPLADSEFFPHDVVFYVAAIAGNGILYSIAAQIAFGVFGLVKKIVGHL